MKCICCYNYIKPKENMMTKRELYIDVLKGIAMLAVIVDHTSNMGGGVGVRYSVLSVGLFIMVLGHNLWFSYERKPDTSIKSIWAKLSNFLLFYCIASVVIYICITHAFNLKGILDYTINFRGSGAYYFCFLYIQFILISGILYKLVKLSNKIYTDILLLALSYGASILFIKYTIMLPLLHGGGKMLLGGTFFFLLVFGFITGKWYKTINNSRLKYLILILGIIAFIISLKYIPKAWSNPSNNYASFYTIASFVVIVSLNMILSGNNFLESNKILQYIRKLLLIPLQIIAFVGKHSLQVFLWHGLVILYLFDYAKKIGLPWLLYVVIVVTASLAIGLIAELIVRKFKKYLL